MRARNFGRIIGAVWAIACTAGAFGAVEYTVTDLGTLSNDPRSYAYRINDAGEIVGISGTGNSPRDMAQPFVYANGSMRALPELGGSAGRVYAIGQNGEIVGSIRDANGTHAVVDNGGAVTVLPGLGGTYDIAVAINRSGQIAGTSYLANPSAGHHAFLNTSGVTIDLGTLGGANSAATGINNAGHVVGLSNTADSGQQAFLYDGQKMVALPFFLNTASAINNLEQIVGAATFQYAPHGFHAYLYDGGKIVDLGTLDAGSGPWSYAYDINDHGEVVGYGASAVSLAGSTGYEDHAFLYRDGAMHDLNDLIDRRSGWMLDTAYGINGPGQIVGFGRNLEGAEHAFLLTPVPEPMSAATCAVAALLLMRLHRRAK
ncbi:MAG: extracellular repeat protein family [Phycisphaerales bacterium]|nr:extracellular repeat protein family [Phycisphaerales bacterium]